MDRISDVWLVTGGGRSGKSEYAENLTKECAAGGSPGVLYIATGVATDAEMEERIAHHREHRPKEWITWEKDRNFGNIESEFDPDDFIAILLDCVGNLLMGAMYELIPDPDSFESETIVKVEQRVIADIDILRGYAKKYGKRLIFVTNEVGMGIIPPTRYSRYFRDSLGRINKYIAGISDKAVLMVAGLPVILK